MASTENSPVPSGRGLKGMLAKARRNKADNSSTTSFNGTEDSNESRGIKESVDSALDKLKAVARGDADNPESPGISGITKLITRPRRRKGKKHKDLGDGVATETSRGRTIRDSKDPASPALGNGSQSTLDDDGESSLMTDDSGEEEYVGSKISTIEVLMSRARIFKGPILTTFSHTSPEPHKSHMQASMLQHIIMCKARSLPLD